MKITHRPRARAAARNDAAFRTNLIRAVGVSAPPTATTMSTTLSGAAAAGGASGLRAPPSLSTQIDRAGRVRSRDGVALDATSLSQLLKPHSPFAARERAASSASLLAADFADVAIEVALAASTPSPKHGEAETGIPSSAPSTAPPSPARASTTSPAPASPLRGSALAPAPSSPLQTPPASPPQPSAAASAEVETTLTVTRKLSIRSFVSGTTIVAETSRVSVVSATDSELLPEPATDSAPAVAIDSDNDTVSDDDVDAAHVSRSALNTFALSRPEAAERVSSAARLSRLAALETGRSKSAPSDPAAWAAAAKRARRGFPVWDLEFYAESRRRRRAARAGRPTERVPAGIVERGDARWVVSTSVPACQQCGVRFTLMLRRHHCRSCGACVCADCTPYKTRDMPRVCRSCNSLRRGTVLRREDPNDVAGLMDAISAGDMLEVEKRMGWSRGVAADAQASTGLTSLHIAASVRGHILHRFFTDNIMPLSWTVKTGAAAKAISRVHAELMAWLDAAGGHREHDGIARSVSTRSRTTPLDSPSTDIGIAGARTARGGTPALPGRSPPLIARAPSSAPSPALSTRSPLIASLGSFMSAAADAFNFALPAPAASTATSTNAHPREHQSGSEDEHVHDEQVLAAVIAEAAAVFVAHAHEHSHAGVAAPPAELRPDDDRIALALVRALLKAGANANATAHNGMTPLHAAAAFGTPSVVKVLLDSGALQARADKNGFTAYDHAKLRQMFVRDAHASDIIALLDSKYAHPDLAVMLTLLATPVDRRPAFEPPAPVADLNPGEWWKPKRALPADTAPPAGESSSATEHDGDSGSRGSGSTPEDDGDTIEDDEDADAEAQTRAEHLPLPPRSQMLEMGLQHLDPAAQALQANLLAVRNSYERWQNERAWAEGYPSPGKARHRFLALDMLDFQSANELGWRRANALVNQVWKLGHPPEADGDVSEMLEAVYESMNPSSPFNRAMFIRADAQLREMNSPPAAVPTQDGGGKKPKKRLAA